MNTNFNELVDNVRNLSLIEKMEIKLILEKSIVEERRHEIHTNYLKSKREYKNKKLKFSNDIQTLKKMMD